MTEVEQKPFNDGEASMEEVAKAYMDIRQRKDGPSAAPLDAKIAAMLPKVRLLAFTFEGCCRSFGRAKMVIPELDTVMGSSVSLRGKAFAPVGFLL